MTVCFFQFNFYTCSYSDGLQYNIENQPSLFPVLKEMVFITIMFANSFFF